MNLFFDILSAFAILSLLMLLIYELKRDMMMFQQNSYRPERYRRWLTASKDSTSYIRLFAVFLVLFSLAGFGMSRFATICITLFSIGASASLARRHYKKPLVNTKRIKRLSVCLGIVSLIIVALAVLASVAGLFGVIQPIYTAIVTLLILYCASHLLILGCSRLTLPIENKINQSFINKARNTINSFSDLKIIGITGSYGKTSTKHYLYRILSEQFETLMTPGSYNTTMGVVRTINEQLRPYHQVFIVEMGAKQGGDIKEICDLVHPAVGIITAVGPQHLETFKTIENVQRTKFELVDSLPSDGIAVLNNDYDIIADTPVRNCEVLRYGIEGIGRSNDFEATDIRYTSSGTSFTLKGPDGFEMDFSTSLLGKYNITNLIAAIAVALKIGVDAEKIKYAVRHIEPVEHRLSLRHIPMGFTILDDAFNSNPHGATMAVEVLSQISSNRSIIITPGMIELGEEQYKQNHMLGQIIARNNIDKVVIIGEYNKDALTQGLITEGYKEENIIYFETFKLANDWMLKNAGLGDVVLIENDLPDTFK